MNLFGSCRGAWPMIQSLNMVTDILVEDAAEFAEARHRVSLGSDLPQEAPMGIFSMTQIAEMLERTLKAPPPAQHSHFPGMKDAALMTVLENDVAEASDCLHRGHFKACIVLCGSILEAALYDYFRRDAAWTSDLGRVADPRLFPKGRKDISSNDRGEAWTIAQLMKFAVDNGVLKARGTEGVRDTLADSRNLIHPAAVLRADLPVSKETAAMAFAQMEYVLAELSSQTMPPRP